MLQKAIAYVSIALLVAAAYSDIRTLRIPNVLVVAVAALGILHLVLLGNPITATYAVGAALLVFFVGCVLFRYRIVGGGDVKLLTATIPLIWYRDLFNFLALMSIIGALLAVAVILVHNYLPLVSDRAWSRGCRRAGYPSLTVLRSPLRAS
jgi:prepilin peptidase CpaA